MPRRTTVEPLDLETLRAEVSAWYALKQQATTLGNELDKRKKRLQGILEKYGETDPSTGSIFLDLGEPVGAERISQLKNQCATRQTLNEEAAEDILTARGMWEEMTELIRVPDDSRILAAYYDKRITDDELAKMIHEKVVYSFFVLDDAGKPVRT